MLTARRGGSNTRPNLSREEFLAVSLAAWHELTVSTQNPIMSDLGVTGPSPEERLRQIGERVGVPAHGRSHSYFIIAPVVSALLIEIERGDYSGGALAQNLLLPGIRQDVMTVILHWSMISGRDLKSTRTSATAPVGASSPPSMPSMATASAPGTAQMQPSGSSTNGKVPVGSS
jgi:hypothetical protein